MNLLTHSSTLYYCINIAENIISGPQFHLLSMFSNSSKSKEVSWYQPIGNNISQFCDEAQVCIGGDMPLLVPSFPSKQISPPCHHPILLMQILLTPAIHTNYCPHPSARANPMALVPASFPPCLPHPLKTPSSYPYPSPCSVPHCLGSLPLSWGEGADPARVSALAAAAGVELAGLPPPPRESSHNLPHYLPQALFRCSGQIPEEECLSCGQIRILAAGLGASRCVSGSNVSMDYSSLWQISWKNTAEKWFPKSDFIAFCLPRRQAPQLSQCVRLHTAVRVTWAVTPDKMPAGRQISLSSGLLMEA